MTVPHLSRIAVAGLALLLAGCATPAELDRLADPEAGFADVRQASVKTLAKDSVWIQSHQQAEEAARRARQLAENKQVDADTAVQIALLNNKALQAAYAEVGLSAVDLWQEALLANPKVTLSYAKYDLTRTIETFLTVNIYRALTREKRMTVAEARLVRAQLQALEATLRLAHETRVAWINAVSAWERAGHVKQAIAAADAGSELAEQLGRTGAIPKAAQAREHVNYAELTAQLASARLEARQAKQALTLKMGLWGRDVRYTVPNRLPELPPVARKTPAIAAQALRNRVDLKIALADLEVVARQYGLVSATRYVSDLDLTGGAELEREDGEEKASPIVEVDFTIPIFDSGEARMRAAELAYMKAANLVAQRAVEVRSQSHGAYELYRGRHEIAQHYIRAVAPLRKILEEQALLNNNGMITSTFDLLQDVRAKVNSDLQADLAKRDFWLAEANLKAAIFGGGDGQAGAGMTDVSLAGGSPEH